MSPDFLFVTPDALFLSTGVIGGIGILGGALALGIRHGIDWDHIAAITDITSSTASIDANEQALVREPAVMLTDESHHTLMAASAVAVGAGGSTAMAGHWHPPAPSPGPTGAQPRLLRFVRTQRRALSLGTLYALGHGTMVVVLGLLAILFSEVLPSWVDPLMERIVGVTLLFLGFYLVFSLYRFFRGEGEFRIRSRWMLVFSGVRKGARRVRAAIFPGAAPPSPR
jgi:high-affinity nickel-transport protein